LSRLPSSWLWSPTTWISSASSGAAEVTAATDGDVVAKSRTRTPPVPRESDNVGGGVGGADSSRWNINRLL
jgi:hypothetical protein